ncbi:MAG: hypothetical protein Q9193_006683 [Seirophora villosa]
MPLTPIELQLLSSIKIHLTQAENVLSAEGLELLACSQQMRNILTKIADTSPEHAIRLLQQPLSVIEDDVERQAITARKTQREDERKARKDCRRRGEEREARERGPRAENFVKENIGQLSLRVEGGGDGKRLNGVDGKDNEDEGGLEGEPVTKRPRTGRTGGQRTARSSAPAQSAPDDTTTAPTSEIDAERDSPEPGPNNPNSAREATELARPAAGLQSHRRRFPRADHKPPGALAYWHLETTMFNPALGTNNATVVDDDFFTDDSAVDGYPKSDSS